MKKPVRVHVLIKNSGSLSLSAARLRALELALDAHLGKGSWTWKLLSLHLLITLPTQEWTQQEAACFQALVRRHVLTCWEVIPNGPRPPSPHQARESRQGTCLPDTESWWCLVAA
jgi:hypothetical protein